MRNLALLLLIQMLASAAALCAPYDIKRDTEGPFKFNFYGVEINKGSSLQRESILFNDPTCPVQLSKNSMTFVHGIQGGGRMQIAADTELSFGQPIMAIEVRHILFDVFGRHMKNLSNLEVRDRQVGPTSMTATWNLFDENDATELLTTVTYVARARLADGTQWVFNTDNLTLALGTLHLEKKIESEKLAPTKP